MGVEYLSVTRFAQALGRVPAELRKELRPQLRTAGQFILDDMRRRAGYSRRIPAATRMTISFSPRGGGVRFRVNARQAPHARALERGNDGSRTKTFRHRVYGKDVWVSQPTRPFFFPALTEGRGQVRKHISDAVRASLREVAR